MNTLTISVEEYAQAHAYMEQEMASLLTEIYRRTGDASRQESYGVMIDMAIRTRNMPMCFYALDLYTSNPEHMTFSRLAKFIVSHIFTGRSDDTEMDGMADSLAYAISFASFNDYMTGYFQGRLESLYHMAKEQFSCLDDVMELMRVPSAFRIIYSRAIEEYELGGRAESFASLAGSIYFVLSYYGTTHEE